VGQLMKRLGETSIASCSIPSGRLQTRDTKTIQSIGRRAPVQRAMGVLMNELITLEHSPAQDFEPSNLKNAGGLAALPSLVRSANILAVLVVRSMELCGVYAFVLSYPGQRFDWSIRTLLRRHNQDQLEVVRHLVCRMHALGGSELILGAQLADEVLELELLVGRSDVREVLGEIACAHQKIAARATLFEVELAALGDMETAALIHRHVVRRNRRDGWLLSVQLAAARRESLGWGS